MVQLSPISWMFVLSLVIMIFFNMKVMMFFETSSNLSNNMNLWKIMKLIKW